MSPLLSVSHTLCFCLYLCLSFIFYSVSWMDWLECSIYEPLRRLSHSLSQAPNLSLSLDITISISYMITFWQALSLTVWIIAFLVIASISYLIIASDYVSTGRNSVQASAMFLDKRTCNLFYSLSLAIHTNIISKIENGRKYI